jgi:RimJ/RimL family protein N-acetyltransferase
MAFFLTTARLGFGVWREADLERAVELWGDPEVSRLIRAGGPPSRAEIAERLARELATQRTHAMQYWPLTRVADGAHVGCAGLRPYRDGMPELGVHLRPAFWRQGFALEAGAAVIRHAFDALGATALFAGHNPANTGSRAMLARLGFRYTHDELYPPTGQKHPSYRLDRDDVGRAG